MSVRALICVAALAALGCGPAGSTTCESSRECSAAGLVCDFARGECVECVSGADCLVDGQVCRASRCEAVAPCTSSRMCPGLVCDPARGYCVECVTDLDCPGDETCDGDGFCQSPPPPCTSDRMCSDMGLVCDAVQQVCVECVREADCTDGFVCVAQTCQRGEVDAGPRLDGGPGLDAGPGSDAGPIGSDAGPGGDAGPIGSDAGPIGSDAGPIGSDAGPIGSDAGPIGSDAGPPAAGCGLMLVLDSSGSMQDSPDSGTDSKYVHQQRVVNQWLTAVDDDAQVGAVLQPDLTNGPSCDMGARGALTVPVRALVSNRGPIATTLANRSPNELGVLFDAMDDAYDGVSMLDSNAPRAVIVVADGGHACTDRSGRSALLQRAADLAAQGVPTYVIALGTTNEDLSTLASRGGTGGAGCQESCAGSGGGTCTTAAECDAGEACTDVGPLPGLFKVCTCATTADCPGTETCQPQDLGGFPYMACQGSGACCSAPVSNATFDADLRAQLDRITLEVCP